MSVTRIWSKLIRKFTSGSSSVAGGSMKVCCAGGGEGLLIGASSVRRFASWATGGLMVGNGSGDVG